VFWELTAIASVFLIWAARTQRAYDAGQRYLIIQIGSGVILLAGILIYYRDTGSIAFNAIGIETLAGQIMLVAIGIKCAFPLLHNWLQDAYPEATITGTVIPRLLRPSWPFTHSPVVMPVQISSFPLAQ